MIKFFAIFSLILLAGFGSHFDRASEPQDEAGIKALKRKGIIGLLYNGGHDPVP